MFYEYYYFRFVFYGAIIFYYIKKWVDQLGFQKFGNIGRGAKILKGFGGFVDN